MAEEMYNLSEAAKLTGLSYTSVSNARAKLEAAGAIVEGKGSSWLIPASALSVLNKPRKKNAAVSPAPEGASLRDLRAAWEHAEHRASALKDEAASAAREAKALKKQLDATAKKVVKHAEQALAQAEAELALAKELTEQQ